MTGYDRAIAAQARKYPTSIALLPVMDSILQIVLSEQLDTDFNSVESSIDKFRFILARIPDIV